MRSFPRYSTQLRPLRILAVLLTVASLACEGTTPVEPPGDAFDLTLEGAAIDLSVVDLEALGDIGVLIGVTPRPEGLAAAPEDEPEFSPRETTAVLYFSIIWLFDNGFLTADNAIFLLVPVIDATFELLLGNEIPAALHFQTFGERVVALFNGGALVPAAAQFLLGLTVPAINQLVNVPEVVATTPVGGATAVDVATTLTIAFSEQVEITATGVTLECPAGTPLPFSGLPALSTSNVTLTPTSTLPEGVTCLGTVLAAEVTDTDGTPDNMAADFAFSFATDAGLGLCGDQVQIPILECQALVALFESTNGPGWANNTGWLVGLEPCSWFGVGCFSGGVTDLFLESNQLTGEIPPELGNLTNVLRVNLGLNSLTGAIPPELANLTSVSRLVLFINQLTGPIPPELGSLTNLTHLWLDRNQLSGVIPPELGSLSNLVQLQLWRNQLTGGIPPGIWNLSNLTDLALGDNPLTGVIPPEIGNLSNLVNLFLSEGQLTGPIPPEIGNLTNLGSLIIDRNQFTGPIPPEIGNPISLGTLGLDGNQLTGVIPPELANLTNLGSLFLNDNLLTGTVPLGVAEVGANASFCIMTGNTLSIPATPEYLNLTSPPGQPICGLIPGG